MFISLLKSKIHRATVTGSELEYEGSITIDSALMDAAGLFPGEKVLVVNLNNGKRVETYVIEGARDSGTICLNGAAAHHFSVGDKVIIMAFAIVESAEVPGFKPKKIRVNEKNKVEKII